MPVQHAILKVADKPLALATRRKRTGTFWFSSALTVPGPPVSSRFVAGISSRSDAVLSLGRKKGSGVFY